MVPRDQVSAERGGLRVTDPQDHVVTHPSGGVTSPDTLGGQTILQHQDSSSASSGRRRMSPIHESLNVF